MTHNIPSTGGKVPVWGPPTAKMNFCEEDYHISSYIAEFINTLSSLGYVYLGICGLYNHRHRKTAWTFFPAYAAIIAVGIGSTLCHATLLYSMQLVDDFSMLLGSAIVVHMVVAFRSSRRVQWLVALGLGLCLAVVVWRHIATGDSAMHQRAFLLMIGTVAYRTYVLTSRVAANEVSRRNMRALAKWGAVAMVGGYALWVADLYWCTPLRETRQAVGLPWAWVLELHGWWHILTGVGVYLFIVLVECIHEASEMTPGTSFELSWPALVQFPHVLKLRTLKES